MFIHHPSGHQYPSLWLPTLMQQEEAQQEQQEQQEQQQTQPQPPSQAQSRPDRLYPQGTRNFTYGTMSRQTAPANRNTPALMPGSSQQLVHQQPYNIPRPTTSNRSKDLEQTFQNWASQQRAQYAAEGFPPINLTPERHGFIASYLKAKGITDTKTCYLEYYTLERADRLWEHTMLYAMKTFNKAHGEPYIGKPGQRGTFPQHLRTDWPRIIIASMTDVSCDVFDMPPGALEWMVFWMALKGQDGALKTKVELRTGERTATFYPKQDPWFDFSKAASSVMGWTRGFQQTGQQQRAPVYDNSASQRPPGY